MSIFINQSEVGKIYVDGSQVSKVYNSNGDLIWQSELVLYENGVTNTDVVGASWDLSRGSRLERRSG